MLRISIMTYGTLETGKLKQNIDSDRFGSHSGISDLCLRGIMIAPAF